MNEVSRPEENTEGERSVDTCQEIFVLSKYLYYVNYSDYLIDLVWPEEHTEGERSVDTW